MNSAGLYPLLETAAKKWPDDISISSALGDFTFAELDDSARSLAARLREFGVHPGHKVGVLCQSGPAYVIATFALFFIDAVTVPIFPGLKPNDVIDLADELHLNAICFDPQFSELIADANERESVILACKKIQFCLWDCQSKGLQQAPDARLVRLGAPLLRFTSGTTSAAKGVIIPQTAMFEYTKRFAESYAISKDAGILNLLSMAHIFYQVTAGLLCGARLFVYETNDFQNIQRAIRSGRVHHVEAAPGFYASLLRYDGLTSAAFDRVKYLTSCGAPLPDQVAESFHQRFGREIVQRYGLTETGPVLINVNENTQWRGSLGRIAPGCEIKLMPLDTATGSDREGEIAIRCPGLFPGYYSPWTPAEKILDNGWYRSGDVGVVDECGYYRIVGRLKNVINVGAVKVFPSEIEQLLCNHPAVEEAVVFGAPDPRFGESPRAKVKLKPGVNCEAKELQRWVNQRLSVFAALREIAYADDLPKTMTGKLKRSGVF